jgi:hypothetical protein
MDEAKLQAAIQFYFQFSREIYEGTDPEELCQKGLIDKGEWMIIMRTILASKSNNKLIEMLRFKKNEFDIVNRNMPFLF